MNAGAGAGSSLGTSSGTTGARARVALVIGSGSVKCAAAIGIQKALIRAGIELDMVVGCSGGAIYAALMAAGHPPAVSAEMTQQMWTREISQGRNRWSLLQALAPRWLRFKAEQFGLRDTQVLARMCDTFGLGVSMHSNSHLGISLMAMSHVAASVPNLSYACDTHYPWQEPDEEIIKGGKVPIANGCVTITTAPGLGVELDRDQLARLHEQFLSCGLRQRDDVGLMRKYRPDWKAVKPRF